MAVARDILAARGNLEVSIQRITELADVGFGSFYNHFTSKDELLHAAITDALDELGRLLEERTASITEPAEAFAAKVRLSARAVDTHPQIAHIIVRTGPAYLQSDQGLASHALADIRRAISAGHFRITDPELALATAGGALLGLLHLRACNTDHGTDNHPEQLAEQLLRGFGINTRDAHTLAHRPLPRSQRTEGQPSAQPRRSDGQPR